MAGPNLPVKRGLSAPAVNSIPQTWSAEWFRRFITNYLQNVDFNNIVANSGTGITVAPGGPGSVGVISANFATATQPGIVPASGGGTTKFLRADFTWDVPAGTASANPSVLVGLTAKNGTATTFMTSDSAPALDQSISPTMTGVWHFSPSSPTSVAIVVTSANGPTTSNADVTIQRAGSTANAYGEGANVQWVDSTAGTFTELQQSGGQTELWMGVGATRHQAVWWSNAGNMNVTAPSAGPALTVNPGAGANGIVINAVGSTTGELVIGGAINGVIATGINNTSAGTAAAADLYVENNLTNTLAMQITSSGFTGSLLTGGPTGQQALVASSGAIPLSIGANQRATVQLSPNGNVVFAAPASGNAVTINGIAGAQSLTINAVGGVADFVMIGTNNGGSISGSVTNLSTMGGTSPVIGANFSVNNSAHAMVMEITGTAFAGSIIPGSPTGEAALIASNGAIPFMFGSNHQYAGQITANQGWIFGPQIAGNNSAIFNSANTGSVGDLVVNRTTSTVNLIAQGANIQFQDTGAGTDTILQHSGGQTELWQFNGAWHQMWHINTTPQMVINAQPSGLNCLVLAGPGIVGSPGVPTLSLNSTGSNYSQLQNDSANTWSIATGTLSNTNGTPLMQWNAFGNFSMAAASSGVTLTVNGTIQGRGPTSGTLLGVSPDTGTFTASGVGFTTTPTSTCTWFRVGNLVILAIGGMSGTSNSTSFSLSGLPGPIQPGTVTQLLPVVADVNNGVTELAAQLQITALSSTITILRNVVTAGWTASGTKSLNTCTIAYLLN